MREGILNIICVGIMYIEGSLLIKLSFLIDSNLTIGTISSQIG